MAVDEIKLIAGCKSHNNSADDQSVLQKTLALWADRGEIDIILTTEELAFHLVM
jgi:hypothetical protein